MIVPEPPVKLEGHCSVIHNNTLYTYSANGFAAIPLERIPLERNETWIELPMPRESRSPMRYEDQQALYVIGGTSSSSNSPGLQRFAFGSRTWTTIQTAQRTMQNRTSHGAVYLKSSSILLVYAGSQTDSSNPSSDTFTISTVPPYTLDAHSAKYPTASPVLLPWSDSEAALVGGEGGPTTAKEVHLFSVSDGWHSSGVFLPQPLSSDVRCAIVNGSDGSKTLESFNLNVSPNNVSSIALLNPGGQPALSGTDLGASSSRKKRRREVSGAVHPTYDGTLAPLTTRSDYSLAQGDNGLVVISSGSGTDSLAIFNQTSNSWVNTTKLFYGEKSSQQILASIPTTTTSSSSTSTATSTSSSISTSTAASDDSSGSRVGTIIGATLGSLVGIILILILILFFLHRTKLGRKRAANQGQGANDKDRLSFQDQGMEPLTRSAYPMAKSTAPLASTSVDSLAIFSGRAADEKTPRTAGGLPGYGPKSSPLKPSPLTAVQSNGDWTPSSTYSVGGDKAIEAQDMNLGDKPPGDRTTDEGWGKYFQDNNGTNTNLANTPSIAAPRSNAEDRVSAWPGAPLPQLNFGFLEEPKPLGRVVTGSPTTEDGPRIGQVLKRAESQSARISTASSLSAASDTDYDHDHDRRDGASTISGPAPDPQWLGAPHHSWIGRPPSSTYSRSFYNPGGRERDTINTRGSSVLIPDALEPMPTTPFPGAPAPANSRNNPNSDLSWLNLNADR
ncbi:uncharacterized protein P174DRAFT_460426 [Aspergillus novofumigatus IBT 16806]|uniref:Pre-mRNA splicing factor Clf1 n=1 Tax=Aspergillus novofumigatus (strain IBT 16806) TaxID=1392255 RepID=A0A2I1C9N4_ASPN1|nr:uncharacterized protein P174DRAFT_460426 [Aspergillus novofumigatus IBT 16806]PKX94349.1 hypothetical protein P174DRAFT_460426 [Aspergillus novofumigatus IBT 16806]